MATKTEPFMQSLPCLAHPKEQGHNTDECEVIL
jgi:hypothetical protein